MFNLLQVSPQKEPTGGGDVMSSLCFDLLQVSPQKEPAAGGDVMSSPEKSKKNKKFRMPSFSKTKDKKVKEKKSAKQSQV